MDKKEIVKKLVNKGLTENEKEELIKLLLDKNVSIDIEKKEEENVTFGDRLADRLSSIAGSWLFIFIFILFLFFWIVLNTKLLWVKIDPYPFILLNLVLSCVAAIQAPIIMMAQNREAKKDSLRNQNDYITDLKSELILEDLHRKLELILENQKVLIEIYEKNK